MDYAQALAQMPVLLYQSPQRWDWSSAAFSTSSSYACRA